MLPQIVRSKPRLQRGSRWCLMIWSCALIALPTWFGTAQSQELKPAIPSGASETPVGKAPSGGTGTALKGGKADVREIEFFPEYSKNEQVIVHELDALTSFDFTDESLNGVRDTIMERHGLNIIIDKNELEGESTASDATDLNLKVNEIPLRSALKLLLQQKNLAYVIEDDVMKITTESALSAKRFTRTYPVQDLTQNTESDFLMLIEAIRQGVTPGAWNELPYNLKTDSSHHGGAPQAVTSQASANSGGQAPQAAACTISMVMASGSLVVYHSWRGHEDVLKLLRALRSAKAHTGK